MDRELIASILHKKGLIDDRNNEFKPLKGGVSSDIYRISDGMHAYVVKQALRKLKVKNKWFADISCNQIEQDFIRFMQSYIPDAVPEVVYRDREHCFFVMEFLGDDYQNWKQRLLNGEFEKDTAIRAAELLVEIHLQSRNKDDVKHWNCGIMTKITIWDDLFTTDIKRVRSGKEDKLANSVLIKLNQTTNAHPRLITVCERALKNPPKADKSPDSYRMRTK